MTSVSGLYGSTPTALLVIIRADPPPELSWRDLTRKGVEGHGFSLYRVPFFHVLLMVMNSAGLRIQRKSCSCPG